MHCDKLMEKKNQINVLEWRGQENCDVIQYWKVSIKIAQMRVMNWLVGVFAEDVPDDHNGLLHNIIDFGLDEVQQGANTTLSWLLYTQI